MSLKFVILGSGSSMGVPRADGYSGNCDLKNKIKSISKVFYTHLHADQTHGINDLRPFFLINKKQIPVYADSNTKKYLLSTFKYCFKSSNGYPSTLTINSLKKKHQIISGGKKIIIESIFVQHGKIKSICYLINKRLAYASDISLFFKRDYKKLKNLEYLIIDCLWYKNHSAHFNLDQVLELVKILSPKKTILTNRHTDLDYAQLKKKLPKNIIPGFDGITVSL